jgi:DNA-binding NtrC family response regulator
MAYECTQAALGGAEWSSSGSTPKDTTESLVLPRAPDSVTKLREGNASSEGHARARFARALVVDERDRAEALASALVGVVDRVDVAVHVDDACALVREAVVRTDPFSLVVLSTDLGPVRARDFLPALDGLEPSPLVVVIAEVGPADEWIELGQLGVRAAIPWTTSGALLAEALERAARRDVRLEPHVRAAVGRIPLRALEDAVRRTMIGEAMARSGGSRRKAARLLDISRQLLQHALRAKVVRNTR